MSLLYGQYDDAAAGPNLNAQVMAVQKQHAHKRGAAYGIGLDVSRPTVPERGDAVYAEAHFCIISQRRLAAEHVGQL